MQKADLYEYLKSLRGERVYFRPNPGNAGDALISHATYQAFHKCGIRYKLLSRFHDTRNKIVLYGGGGNLVTYYRKAAQTIARVHQHAKRLIILPHTINAHETLLRQLGGNVDIICREQQSFDFVKREATNANVLMMDDLAFSLDVEETLRQPGKARWLNPILWGYRGKCILAKALLTTKGNPSDTTESHKTLNSFRTDSERPAGHMPPGNVDISRILELGLHGPANTRLVSHHLLKFINRFEEINTNRLHVCISGILLGKTVNFYANNYDKNQNVFDFSIRDRIPNVRWMGPTRGSARPSVASPGYADSGGSADKAETN